MKLIMGLGNPGDKYIGTRHNIGFFFADKLRELWNFPEFEFNKKFNALTSKGSLPLLPSQREGARRADEGRSEEILLAKPQTFMNLSGIAVRSILDFYKLTAADIIVIHDDLDIAVGKYKISKNISSAGHNGIDSIIEKIGMQDFTRVRIGVEMEAGRQARKVSGEDYVLQKFSKEESKKIYPALLQIIENELPKLILDTD